MIELLDYILDNDDNFWIVNNITNGEAKGYIVYRVSDTGRLNYVTGKRYIKDNDRDGIVLVPKSYKCIFKPRKFYKDNKNKLNGVWKDYVDLLNKMGIKDDNIGIFGSYLIGFPIEKDIDFGIYGIDNLFKYYKSIDYIRDKLDVTSITLEHIDKQYNKHKDKFLKKCDLKEIIGRNWSGIELSNGVLSTPRFIDLDNMSIDLKSGIDKVVVVEVKDGIYSAMLPRRCKVFYNDMEYDVVSTLWKFQSFAHIGDIIEIYGNVDDKKRLIILDDNKYYIRYIKKGLKIIDENDSKI